MVSSLLSRVVIPILFMALIATEFMHNVVGDEDKNEKMSVQANSVSERYELIIFTFFLISVKSKNA